MGVGGYRAGRCGPFLASHHAGPWLAADDGTAAREHVGVWSTTPSRNGSWRITVHADPFGRTTSGPAADWGGTARHGTA